MSDNIALNISFDDVQDALVALDALGRPSEVHGMLSAFFAAEVPISESAWVDSLITHHVEATDVKGKTAYQVLLQLFRQTRGTVFSESFGFELLLPDDTATIGERVEALAEWCQGFLTALNLLAINIEHHPDQAVDEALKDLIQLSKIELNAQEAQDADIEETFSELAEHAKVAALLVAHELGRAQNTENKTIH